MTNFRTIEDYVIVSEDTPPKRAFTMQNGCPRRGYIISWLAPNPITNWHGGTFIEDNGIEWMMTYKDGIGWEMCPINKDIFERIAKPKAPNAPNAFSEQWFDECFTCAMTNKPYNIPSSIRDAAEQICRAYDLKGKSDPMYIANVIARRLGLGDGASNFNNSANHNNKSS